MKRILLPMLLIAAMNASAEPKVPTEKSVRLDLDGDGKAETVVIRAHTGDSMTDFEVLYAGQTLEVEGNYVCDGEGSWPKLKPVTPFSSSHQEWLEVTGVADGITLATCYVGLKKGELSVIALFEEKEVKVPGNNSILVDADLGFWSRRVKWAIDANNGLKLVPQEFYSVGSSDVKVKRSFPLLVRRDSEDIVARSREDSFVEIVLWQGKLPLNEAKILAPHELERNIEAQSWLKGWYLIKTETGLMGWIRSEGLDELLELRVAG